MAESHVDILQWCLVRYVWNGGTSRRWKNFRDRFSHLHIKYGQTDTRRQTSERHRATAWTALCRASHARKAQLVTTDDNCTAEINARHDITITS